MAALFAVLVSVNLIFSNVRLSRASTHWIVTEDGKIQSQMDSMFNMKRPYDLVAFMKQEERASMLDKLKKELLSRKDEIDKTEDRDTGLEEKFYKSDMDCLAAGKHLPDLDLYISTVLPLENKGIRPEDYIAGFTSGSVLMQPDCTLYTDLEYSPHAFEHLEGMKDRGKLSGTPELGLKNAITYQDNVDEYGHRIYEAFKLNKTSWVLYNMAAFYWRIKGDPYNVIECVRRALHFSPRMQKDVALISLANVLHRARFSNEAAIVVHAALDVSKELNVNHFTLGNIYAVLGEYNKSVICFENTLKIQPDFEAAAKRKHAVLCHAKLENALEAQHRSLQRTLNDLKDYQRKHDYWQQQNDKLLAEQVPVELKLSQHMAYEEVKMKEMSTEIGEYCKMGDRDGKQVLMCSWGHKADAGMGLDLAAAENKMVDPKIFEDNEKHGPIPKDGKIRDYSKPVKGHKYVYETVKVPRYHGSQEYLNEDWPSKEECDLHVQKVPDARNLTSTYMSPENKGYEVAPLLTEALGLKPGDEHPLPWYPPVCVTLLDIPEGNTKSHDDIFSISYEQRTKIPLKLFDNFHTQTLLEHVNNGKVTIEEIGQRILTALKKNLGPKWILFNLAGLYWRIIGNNYHGIECFRRAVYTAPDDVQDVPEVNLANILYRWGRYDDALRLVAEAMKLNKFEPATMFILGNIHWAQKNYTGAIWRYQLALEAEPNNNEVLSTLRALKCYLKYHQAAQSAAPAEYNSKEGGEEKCVIETRTRGRGECEGTCTQTCSIAPVTEMCGGGNPTVDGPEGRKHATCGQCNSCCNRCQPKCGAPSNSCKQPKGPKEPSISSVSEELLLSEEFSSKFQEVSEHMEKNGLCEGDECSQLKLGNGQQPHIKLDFVNGVLRQKLIFAQSPNELTVESDECVIFNDGTKSDGCDRPEFRAYVRDFESLNSNPEAVTLSINGHLTKILPIHIKSNQVKSGDSQPVGPEKVPPFTAHIVVNNPPQQEASDGMEKTRENYQLPNSAIPDQRKYIGRRLHLAIPKLAECKKMKKMNLKKFSSTWLSLSAKRINVKDYIDFDRKLERNRKEPQCNYEVPTVTVIDHLPGVQHRSNLGYLPESGLKEVLQKISGKLESVEDAGARIAYAMEKNETSWVLANMAALYWRVKGNARIALDCLRIALHSCPEKAKDTALLSASNILHRAGYINDAIVATGYSLDVTPNLVVGHFNMANLYAAKGQWDYASIFYESTLGLQATFEPAKSRLRTILCMRVAQRPEILEK